MSDHGLGQALTEIEETIGDITDVRELMALRDRLWDLANAAQGRRLTVIGEVLNERFSRLIEEAGGD